MGSDIHGVIEYKRHNTLESFDCYAKLEYLPRRYDIFSRLANVRGNDALINPKGLPTDMSYVTKDMTRLYVIDDDKGNDGEHVVKRSVAEKWVKFGSSKYVDGNQWVIHPDYHSHSYLNLQELKELFPKLEDLSIEYTMIFTLLKEFEKKGYDARFVFWFDN